MILIILLMFINSSNQLLVKGLMVSFYKAKVRKVINGDVISLYLYRILHPP